MVRWVTSRPTIVSFQPRVEDHLGGLGVVVDVGLGGRRDIALGDRAAHDHDFLDERHDARVLEDGQRDVGQRADRDERELPGHLVDHLDDQVGGEAGIGLAARGRQLDVAHAVLAVHELRGDELLGQRAPGAARDRDVAAPGQRDELERVLQALLAGHVSGNDRERPHVDLGRARARAGWPSRRRCPGSVSMITGARRVGRAGRRQGHAVTATDRGRRAKASTRARDKLRVERTRRPTHTHQDHRAREATLAPSSRAQGSNAPSVKISDRARS